mmetsp:Transcript_28441/g.91050  ORF Transcript_28441/g.91050 Transcript_28441/m.91050 type:complete len:220 (+) Transcript_28441:1175-1834(+)
MPRLSCPRPRRRQRALPTSRPRISASGQHMAARTEKKCRTTARSPWYLACRRRGDRPAQKRETWAGTAAAGPWTAQPAWTSASSLPSPSSSRALLWCHPGVPSPTAARAVGRRNPSQWTSPLPRAKAPTCELQAAAGAWLVATPPRIRPRRRRTRAQSLLRLARGWQASCTRQRRGRSCLPAVWLLPLIGPRPPPVLSLPSAPRSHNHRLRRPRGTHPP